VTTIERLNELLEAERAGVETLSLLAAAAEGRDQRGLFEQVRDDEARSCAGLIAALHRLGGPVSRGRGDFADKVRAQPTLPARLRLLNRGQQWVVTRLDALLAEPGLDAATTGFLREMRAAHVRNVERCEALIAALERRSRESTGGRGSPAAR